MASKTYALGVDYGTSSVRGLVVDTATGEEVGTHVWPYPGGQDGVLLDDRDPNLARQDPANYFEGFRRAVAGALAGAEAGAGVEASSIVGIGVDTTGSTPVPVDAAGVPVAMGGGGHGGSGGPDAMAWLWKDHTAHAEAAEISEKVRAMGLPYLAKCGGTYSSEWYWSKILRCERANPALASRIHGWVECCDLVPGWLTGNARPETMARSICAAGHKAMYHESWGGLPSGEFLEALSPGLSRFRDRYAVGGRAVPSDQVAGGLTGRVAAETGLPAGLPVAVGAFDAHMGAVGAGIREGTLVKIMGTSTCDCMVASMDRPLADIPGVCGIVPESVLPGMHGIEAGQSAVGDIFDWFVRRMAPSGFGAGPEMHAALTRAAAALAPGESGLVALDWHNGNRTVLVDPLLTGVILGETLATTPPEVYRALIEATAFGALAIIERIEEFGVPVREIVNCGGIAEKSPLVMQIYADVTGRPMKVSRSAQTCALGAAIFGSVVGKAHPSAAAAQAAMTGVKAAVYHPNPAAVAVYRRLGRVYRALHDAFGVRGGGRGGGDLSWVMKELIAVRQEARRSRAGGGS